MSGLSQSHLSAPLRKVDLSDEGSAQINAANGSAVLVKLKTGKSMEEARKIWNHTEPAAPQWWSFASSAYAQRMFDMLAKDPHRFRKSSVTTNLSLAQCW